ncbi:hypothetical protein [Metabacillus halosaccharovorans]|uniref:hypothetical protein n=1 Tax=Metabacillus halosaccharovorans TaxID=930124 RepID=UPI000994DC69|nr:hypothetical protein [Metabacillus halosaccharovorans]
MSIRFEVIRTVKVTKQRAYFGLLDLDSAQNWMKGFVKIERMDEGPLKVGSEWSGSGRLRYY